MADDRNHPSAPSGAVREKLGTRYDLVPFQEIADAYMRVAEHGAVKYAPWNWSAGLPRTQIIASLLRHTWAYLRGEDRDSDSGLSHVDHILWNAAALAHSEAHGICDDRRPEPKRFFGDARGVGAEPDDGAKEPGGRPRMTTNFDFSALERELYGDE